MVFTPNAHDSKLKGALLNEGHKKSAKEVRSMTSKSCGIPLSDPFDKAGNTIENSRLIPQVCIQHT